MVADFYDLFNKSEQPPTPAAATVNGPRREGGIHPYARAIRDAWVDRLQQLKSRPWAHGDAWDSNCFVSARKLIELSNSPWAGYPAADAHSDYLHHAPHDGKWDKRQKCWNQAEKETGGKGLPEPAPGDIPQLPALTILTPTPDLTDQENKEFWQSRDILNHLHDFARARRVSPWAVLGVTLARIVTATPYKIGIPPTIGGRSSLNLFVGLVGRSGSGKGAAEAVAAEAITLHPPIEVHKTGSGEGIAHGYRYRIKGEVEWRDDQHAVLFSVPEIDAMAAQSERRGATLMPELRSGWSGENLGFGYADPSRRLPVPAHEYRMCLIVGIQPRRAGCLLNDSDAGTPQRFLWMPATDRGAPDTPPAEPPPHKWDAPHPPEGAYSLPGPTVAVCRTARQAIDGARLARLREDGNALDGHALLSRLKTAAALGILDGRYEVTDEDWDLAGIIHAKSDAVRTAIEADLAQQAQERNHAQSEAEAYRAVHVSEKVADASVKRVCGVIVRRLKGGPMPRGKLRSSVAGRDRAHFATALDRLLETGQVEQIEGSQAAHYQLKEEK